MDNQYYTFKIMDERKNMIIFGSKSFGVRQAWIKKLKKIGEKQCLSMSHKLFFMKHVISTFLLPYQQYKIASINKTFYKHICGQYQTPQFIRDALYWNKLYNCNYYNHKIKFDFIKTLKSMNILELMQLKYNVIYLDKINQYIITKHSDTHNLQISLYSQQQNLNENIIKFIQNIKIPIIVDILDFSAFNKPQMLMTEKYSYSSSESDDEHYIHDDNNDNNDNNDDIDRFKYICDILQYSTFDSCYNTIKEINLSDNSLNNKELSQILSSIKSNKNCLSFDNISCLNLSQNMFIGNVDDEEINNYQHQDNENNVRALIFDLFDVVGTKFPNLQTLNLSETGVNHIIFDAIIYFIDKYSNNGHNLHEINLKHCDELFISDDQYKKINPFNINSHFMSIIYDNHASSKKCLFQNNNYQTDDEDKDNNDDENDQGEEDDDEEEEEEEEEFEYGFDCNCDDSCDEQDDIKEQPKFGLAFDKRKEEENSDSDDNDNKEAMEMDDKHIFCDTNTLQFKCVDQPQSDISEFTDDDGFVYMEDEMQMEMEMEMAMDMTMDMAIEMEYDSDQSKDNINNDTNNNKSVDIDSTKNINTDNVVAVDIDIKSINSINKPLSLDMDNDISSNTSTPTNIMFEASNGDPTILLYGQYRI